MIKPPKLPLGGISKPSLPFWRPIKEDSRQILLSALSHYYVTCIRDYVPLRLLSCPNDQGNLVSEISSFYGFNVPLLSKVMQTYFAREKYANKFSK